MNRAPYVSIVIVGRNDDYGDNFLERINTFVRSLDHQIRHYPGLFELVVVEWNPLPDKTPLVEVLHTCDHLTVRVITVSSAIHDAMHAVSPVLEFHGKNVGVRRARGEFVLVTNPDILFTQEMIDELGKKKLRLDTVYRTDRYDFRCHGIDTVPSQDLIDFAMSNVFVVHAMRDRSSVSIPIDGATQLSGMPGSSITSHTWHTNGCGDFLLAAREVFFTVRGMYETLQHKWHVDSISLYRFAAAQVKQHVFLTPLCVFHQHHERKDQDISIGSLNLVQLAQQPGSTDWGLKNIDLPEITQSSGR